MNIKIRGKNPAWIIFSVCVIWRYINTFVIISEDKVSISRYLANPKNNFFHKQLDTFKLEDLVKVENVSSSKDVQQEEIKRGPYGKYQSQEIKFYLKDGSIIAWNARPYTKKQVKDLLELITNKSIVLQD